MNKKIMLYAFVLILVCGIAVWSWFFYKGGSVSPLSNAVDTTQNAQGAASSVADKANPFSGADISPFSGYKNPFGE